MDGSIHAYQEQQLAMGTRDHELMACDSSVCCYVRHCVIQVRLRNHT